MISDLNELSFFQGKEARLPRQSLKLTKILRCLKSSAPDVGSGYNKSDALAGNLVRQIKTLIPENREAAITMQKENRIIINLCPKGIKGDIDIGQNFGSGKPARRHQPN